MVVARDLGFDALVSPGVHVTGRRTSKAGHPTVRIARVSAAVHRCVGVATRSARVRAAGSTAASAGSARAGAAGSTAARARSAAGADAAATRAAATRTAGARPASSMAARARSATCRGKAPAGARTLNPSAAVGVAATLRSRPCLAGAAAPRVEGAATGGLLTAVEPVGDRRGRIVRAGEPELTSQSAPSNRVRQAADPWKSLRNSSRCVRAVVTCHAADTATNDIGASSVSGTLIERMNAKVTTT